MATGSQGCQSFALWLGILPEEGRALAARRLHEDLVRRDYRITTGNLCTRYLMDALTENGYVDDAWRLITREEYPSIGYMLQHDLLFEWRNVWQNVTLGLEIAHKDTVKNLERVHRMLSDYGLLEFQHKKPSQLSGGMRQRVVIAIAVACSPKILICDEPTTALDVTIQAQILQLLKEMRFKYDLTIVMITHDLGVVANIADRVAVMYAGDIVEIGTADEIYYDPRHPYTWALLSSMPQMGVKGEDLFNIVGTPPNLFAEIRGDAFAPRNPQALKIDFVKRPPYFKVTPTHKAKTWLLDPRAPKIEPPAAVKMLREEGL